MGINWTGPSGLFLWLLGKLIDQEIALEYLAAQSEVALSICCLSEHTRPYIKNHSAEILRIRQAVNPGPLTIDNECCIWAVIADRPCARDPTATYSAGT